MELVSVSSGHCTWPRFLLTSSGIRVCAARIGRKSLLSLVNRFWRGHRPISEQSCAVTHSGDGLWPTCRAGHWKIGKLLRQWVRRIFMFSFWMILRWFGRVIRTQWCFFKLTSALDKFVIRIRKGLPRKTSTILRVARHRYFSERCIRIVLYSFACVSVDWDGCFGHRWYCRGSWYAHDMFLFLCLRSQDTAVGYFRASHCVHVKNDASYNISIDTGCLL